MNVLVNLRSVSWIKPIIYMVLILVVYQTTLIYLLQQWRGEDFTYCYLIPFIFLYLVWEKRDGLSKHASSPSWKGLILLMLGITFFWLGELGGEYFTLFISFWLVFVGLCWIHLGWQKLKTITFALIIMLAMFPFPDFIYNKISVKLQLVSTQLGVAILHLTGMSAFREGNVIDLGFTQLQVVDACSGLRYVIPLMILGLLLAYFFRAAFWKRAVVFLSTIPLAILTNAMRIAITGVLFKYWGARVAEGFFHGVSAWFIFLFSLAILMMEMGVLKIIFPGGKTVHSSKELADSSEDPSEIKARAFHPSKTILTYGAGGASLAHSEGNTSQNRASGRKPGAKRGFVGFFEPHFIVAVILLGLTWALSSGIEFREKIPIKKSLTQFPMQMGEWTGNNQTMEQAFVDTLDLSDYTIVDYKNAQGKAVNFYVAYYESQRKGESIHTPATCLPGGGWIFKQAGAVTVPLPGHNQEFMRVNRAFMHKSGYRQLSYYWFPQRGRILTNAYQLKIFAFWDALTKHRTDGALVRLITPVYESEELEDADARLQGFTREVVPLLSEFIPD